ncbi:MAG: sialate O-acetylesterase [Planctomycetota bacterium]|nr:sialate O-acetylesterase [Planctomycetota bacterium]
MRHAARLTFTVAVVVALGALAQADVKLPAIIGSNMVLQADMKAPIWGWADPGEKVTVTLGDQKAEAAADKDGKWQVRLEAMKAGAGPLEMTVAGKNTLKLANILVGEVWICSGQSNMAMSVKSSGDSDKEIAEAKYPKIRLFKVANVTSDTPLTDVKGQWEECSPETVPGFSAAGYFFGRDLFKALGVPVGLVHTNWGGTPAEAWTSREGLESEPTLKPIYERYEQTLAAYPKAKESWEAVKDKRIADWEKAAQKAKADGKAAPRKPGPPAAPGTGAGRPSCLYNGMIAPLIPLGIRGAIWYQGESNAGRPLEYRRLFPAMIQDWRKHWGQGEFPFLFVQLANFMARKDEPADSNWAALREAQTLTLALPKTGQAVIIDIGEGNNIHPKNKQDVGKRLALAALAGTYGKDVVYSGPMYESMKAEGDKVVLKFKHVGGGLVAKGDKLTGFAIAGEDKKFVWADARIDGDTIVVSAKDVAKPAAVRYAWADNPDCNLYNKADLPACPFRTDDWPVGEAAPPQPGAPQPKK